MSRRGWLLLLIALLAAHVGWLSSGLVYPDLARDFPHQASDSCEWLSNGLHRAGYPTRDTVRPPLYPWLLAQATRWEWLPWMPVFGQAVMAAGALLLFVVLCRRHEGLVAWGVSLAFFLGHRFQSLGLDLMADHLAAVLLFASLVAFRRSANDPRFYLLAGLTGGLSAVGDVTTKHWGLLGWNDDGAGFYFRTSIVLFGVIPWVLAWIGGIWLVRRRDRDVHDLVFPAAIATILAFFVLAYTWDSERFLLYLYLPVGILVAAGVDAFRGRALRQALLIVVIVSMAWPWHLPPRRALEQTAQMRVWRERWAFDSRRASRRMIEPSSIPSSVRHAVFLHGADRPRVDRYRLSCRLGNELRRRVSYVPGGWWTRGAGAAGFGPDSFLEGGTVLGFEAKWLRPPVDEARDVLPHPDAMVALFPCHEDDGAGRWDGAARALAVALGTPSLFVATGAERAGLRQLIDSGDQGPWQAVGDLSLRRVAAGGWRGWEVQSRCR